ncbi:MAG: glycerophosphoryl diester phosphodiesterase [Chloroflexi bacterium]|nr:glycerophosphoryl diester phosphodiesterase [Chloroflexota bacterium]
MAAPAGPNPESVIRTAAGRVVQLKVHRGLWSGDYPENSLPAIEECYREAVARTEIDIHMLRDADFLVLHDPEVDASTTGTGAVADLTRQEAGSLRLRFGGGISAERPPLFSEVVALIAAQPYPTLVELDLPGFQPLPWPRAEWLARLVEPVRDRVVFNGADWNLRRLLRVDPTLPVSFDPGMYFDWVPEGDPEEAEMELPRGAYGYFDAHPLARERLTPVGDYLADRLGGISRLVPGAREAHVRFSTFERMLDDGVADAADLFHRQGLLLDVWTLNAGTPGWRERLARVLAAGVDVVTSDTPRELAEAGRAESGG